MSWSASYLWATLGVKALYSSTPHSAALKAVKHHLNRYSSHSWECWIFVINFFFWNTAFMSSTKGHWCGQDFFPPWGIFTWDGGGELCLFSADNPFVHTIAWYGHYIDDLLMMWDGDDISLHNFDSYINNNQCDLQFTVSLNSLNICFLDINLCDDPGTVAMHTCTYRKPCSVNTAPYATSCHPSHTIHAILMREFFRAQKNCSSDSALSKNVTFDPKSYSEFGFG